jgi:sugar phosphate permease
MIFVSDMVKKIPSGRWLRIIPPTILIYIFSFMDRTNIGFAMAGGMNEALQMTASISGLAAGIFFIGYIVLQVPGGHIAEHGNGKKFIAGTIIAWSALCIALGFVQTANQLLVVRFLIGVAEGGVWPAVLVIISHWFPNEERGRANAYFIMNIAIASIITGPISGWIVTDYGWRWVFIIEGCVSFLLIFVWWPLVDNHPSEAKWISLEEREYVEGKLAEEQKAIKTETGEKVSFKEILSSGNMWKLIMIYFFYQTGIYGFTMWLPSILKGLTNGGMISVGFLSTVPWFACIVGLYVISHLSDKSMNRRFYVALPLVGFAICFFASTLFGDSPWVAFAFLVACGLFIQSASSIFWTLPPILFPAEVAGESRGVINALGNLGGFIGPFAVGWLKMTFDSYNAGIYFLVATLMAGFFITLTLPDSTAGKNLNRVDKNNKL